MKCQCHYCIYNKNFLCILEEPEINSLGMCEDCILVSISDDVLERLKETQLADMDSR